MATTGKIIYFCDLRVKKNMSEEPSSKKQKTIRVPQTRRFCLTCNNYTDSDIPQPHEWIAYCCYSFEIGEQGTRHIQGYFETNARCTLKRLKKEVNWLSRYHIEKAYEKATLLDQKLYIQKLRDKDIAEGVQQSSNFTEFGTPLPAQGARVDLDQLAEQLYSGKKTYSTILKELPIAIHTYGRTLLQIEDEHLTKRIRTHMTQGIWLFGRTGVGKSFMLRRLETIFGPAYIFSKDKGWHDLYRGQDIIACDDYRGHIDYDDLLKYVDTYQIMLSRRGRPPIPITSKIFFITSPLRPEEVYHHRNVNDKIEQLHRRFIVLELNMENRNEVWLAILESVSRFIPVIQ